MGSCEEEEGTSRRSMEEGLSGIGNEVREKSEGNRDVKKPLILLAQKIAAACETLVGNFQELHDHSGCDFVNAALWLLVCTIDCIVNFDIATTVRIVNLVVRSSYGGWGYLPVWEKGTHEVLEVASSASGDEVWLYSVGADKLQQYSRPASAQRTMRYDDVEFGSIVTPITFIKKPAGLARAFNSLVVLQDINKIITSCLNSEYDVGKLFFSSLGSVCTISDCILRKMRGFMMAISLDCTRLELLDEEVDKSSGKPKEKPGICNRKKKGRTRNAKRQNPVPKTCMDGISRENPPKDIDYLVDNKMKDDLAASGELPDVPSGKEISMKCSSSTIKMVAISFL
ncbi:hypothetical protein Lal_00021171 [Lupinus albus]|nr:hypothetical protein Lal_00021171 [Lupinus albus]